MTTDFAFLQADVAGHSRISRSNPSSTVEDVLESLETHVDTICSRYDGRIWNWAGDGGLIAFYDGARTQKVVAAVSAAMELLQSLSEFNRKHPLEVASDQIQLRVAVHYGSAHYRTNTGRIHSPAINFVAHLEHDRTHIDSVSVSEDVYRELPVSLRERFVSGGTFENIPIYTSDLIKQAGFPQGAGKWKEITDGLQLLVKELSVPDGAVMIAFYRSGAAIAGMLAPNLGVKTVIVLGREHIHDDFDRFVTLRDVVMTEKRTVIFVSLGIDSADAVVRKLAFFERNGVSKVVIASIFISPNALLRLRERGIPVVFAEERELTNAFFDSLPWMLGATYDHR